MKAHPTRGGFTRVELLAAVAIVLAFLLSPALSSRLDPADYAGGRSRSQADILQRNTSAPALILGEIRASMSDLMFIKTERYLDRGVAYYPHIDVNALSAEGKVKTKGEEETSPTLRPEDEFHEAAPSLQLQLREEEAHEHEGESPEEHAAHADEGEEEHVKTIIRGATDDFRGFIGWLERNVKPWRDPSQSHQHDTEGTELLPWFRLQTLSNPKNVRSYLIGSWWLKNKGPAQVEEALRFVEEGIRHNPDSFQLYLMKGTILRRLEREEDAVAAFRTGAELLFTHRPPQGDQNPNAQALGWDRYLEQDARTIVRMAVLVEKKLGHRDSALEIARKYLDLFETDPILERQIAILTGQIPDSSTEGPQP